MSEASRRRVILSSDRKEEIAELAELVSELHFPAACVEPTVIAERKGITLSFGHYKDAYDGLLEHRAGRFHIYCNLDRLEHRERPRARFTVAHELGHFFIEEHRIALASGRSPGHGSFAEYESKNLAEQEADHFASNLLMPQGRFVRSAKGKPAGMRGIMALAAEFGTSVTSAAIRYASLEVKPCLVVKWSADGYQWKWLSTSAREANYRKTIESPSNLVAGSPTAKALAGEAPPDGVSFRAATTAAAWFPYATGGSRRDIILIEEAIPLGRFGVLTFLHPESGDFRPEPF
jgi:hypothetical protein